MKKLFDSIIGALEAQTPAVLVSVIASSGSTPRGAGAMMAVFPDGTSVGTIGGGAVEFEAQKQAGLMFDSKLSHIASYKLAKNDVADLGMICGGDVTVFYEYLAPLDSRNLELFRYMLALLDKNENAWLIRRFDDAGTTETTVFDSAGLHFAVLTRQADIMPLLGNAPELTDGTIRYYAEPLTRAGKVYIFGGGHVAQELVPVLSHVGFSVVVYDDREAFTRPELFPGAAGIVFDDLLNISKRITITDSDYVVVMTRGHQKDFEVLEQTLKTPARYVGCIGSARKIETTKRRLLEAGVAQVALDNLHSPIGLKIKAETPAEIAISIAAELILFRAENL